MLFSIFLPHKVCQGFGFRGLGFWVLGHYMKVNPYDANSECKVLFACLDWGALRMLSKEIFEEYARFVIEMFRQNYFSATCIASFYSTALYSAVTY